jgi:hypothetical protein
LPRSDTIRVEILRLIRTAPFRKFVLSLENGDRALIEHPENIAFDPESNGSEDFYVISGKLRLFSTFSAVTSIALADREGAAA